MSDKMEGLRQEGPMIAKIERLLPMLGLDSERIVEGMAQSMFDAVGSQLGEEIIGRVRALAAAGAADFRGRLARAVAEAIGNEATVDAALAFYDSDHGRRFSQASRTIGEGMQPIAAAWQEQTFAPVMPEILTKLGLTHG